MTKNENMFKNSDCPEGWTINQDPVLLTDSKDSD